MKKIIKLIPLMLILVLALTSCQKNAENSGKPKVYTSFYAMYDFAKTIGGDDIDLTNIVPTGTEPHDFEPTASDMAKLSEADIFIYNGVGMESWADKIIETLPQSVKVICTSEQIPTDGNDPHIWLSPQNAKLQMQAICNALSEVDSKNAQNYINRLDSYLSQIDEVDTEYKNAKLDGKTIFVTHGAYSYLCNDYGMKQVALEGVTGDSDPSPSQMAKVVDQIKSEGVSCIFYDPLEGDKMAQAVANEADIQALPLYTFEGDSERRLINLITDQVYEKEKNNKMMIGILSQIVEFRNSDSGMHVRNISTLTGMLLEKIVQKTDKYYLSWSERFYITNGSVLHDIGKIGIPEEILNKPGKFTKEEYEIMKEHTVIGEKMLKNLELYQDEPLVKTACEIVRWHHERYDGKGYPDGLKGDKIPISAQIVSIADVYDELVSERVYKKAFSHEKAMEMILNGECGAFNPLLLECLVEIQDRIKTELDGSGSVKKETYKKTIQEIERDMNINTL